jgi:lysyl-tRNA synthetase, class II
MSKHEPAAHSAASHRGPGRRASPEDRTPPREGAEPLRQRRARARRARKRSRPSARCASTTPMIETAKGATCARRSRSTRSAVRVAGRVIFLRSFGGGAFVRLRSWSELPVDKQSTDPTLPARWASEEIQLYCQSKSSGDPLDGGTVLGDLAVLDDVDLGDFVEAEGTTMATQKGELSITPDELRVITKSHRPLPTKTSFKDVESALPPALRRSGRQQGRRERVPRAHRDRVGAARVPRRSRLPRGRDPDDEPHRRRRAREALQHAPQRARPRSSSCASRPSSTSSGSWSAASSGSTRSLVATATKGLSTRHNPEFTMLEYYQAYATYETLMDQTEELLRYVDGASRNACPTPTKPSRAAQLLAWSASSASRCAPSSSARSTRRACRPSPPTKVGEPTRRSRSGRSSRRHVARDRLGELQEGRAEVRLAR